MGQQVLTVAESAHPRYGIVVVAVVTMVVPSVEFKHCVALASELGMKVAEGVIY